MYIPLQTASQLHLGSLLRQVVYEGDEQFQTVYKVVRVGENYYGIEMIEQNGVQLKYEQQAFIPFVVANIQYHGFEIFVDEG